jgi:hypothetical protein
MNSTWLNSAGNLVAIVVLCAAMAQGQAPEPNGAGLERGVLPAQWITGGPDCSKVPKWQVHAYNPDLYILRESCIFSLAKTAPWCRIPEQEKPTSRRL